MKEVIGVIGIIIISIVLTYIIKCLYKKALAMKSSGIIKEISGREGESSPTIADLQALADYLMKIKNKEIEEEDDDDEIEKNNISRGMYN